MTKFDANKLTRIKELLEEEESFPLNYTFKFIVPIHKLSEIVSLFPGEENMSTRPSSKGSYISVTVIKVVESADHVIRIYESVSIIEGVVSL